MHISRIAAALWGALCGLMLAFPAVTARCALSGLTVFVQGVLPTLFPFSVCALMLTGGRTVPLSLLYALAMLGGSPAGARLFESVPLSPAQARCAAAVTGVMSPMFFLGTLSLWLSSARDGVLLWLVHLLSALSLLPFFRTQGAKTRAVLPPLTLPQALSRSAQSMLNVGACICFFTVLSGLSARVLPLPDTVLFAVQALLEVSSGCRALIGSCLSRRALFVMLSSLCAFGGLSLLLQNAACYQQHHLRTGQLLPLCIVRGAAAAIISLLLSH